MGSQWAVDGVKMICVNMKGGYRDVGGVTCLWAGLQGCGRGYRGLVFIPFLTSIQKIQLSLSESIYKELLEFLSAQGSTKPGIKPTNNSYFKMSADHQHGNTITRPIAVLLFCLRSKCVYPHKNHTSVCQARKTLSRWNNGKFSSSQILPQDMSEG